MTKTYRIAEIHVGSQLSFQPDKESKVPESLFWLLVEDKLRQQHIGNEDQLPESLATIKEHFGQDGKVKPIIIENIIFSTVIRK
jgi:hypothetical protein